MTKNRKTVSLVLGSGGARGLTHIGVIRWLEENNFEIKSISGSSIGALIGGVYAAGKLDQLENWMLALTKTDIASLLDFSWGSGGVFKGDKIINTLINLIHDIQIEDLHIPFTAVATDVVQEKEVWINSGSLFEAIRASVSLPLFFTPIKNGDSILIDGGVLNPVPIAPTFNDKTDFTIAVNLGAPTSDTYIKKKNEINKNAQNSKIQIDIKSFINSISTGHLKPQIKNWNMYQVADKAFDTMQSAIGKMKIASYPPDLEIQIARNACGTFEFDRAAEMIQLGYEMTQNAYKTSRLNEK